MRGPVWPPAGPTRRTPSTSPSRARGWRPLVMLHYYYVYVLCSSSSSSSILHPAGPVDGVHSSCCARKGTNGVSTNGVTANFMFFDRGTFWVLPLTYFYLPKSARAYLFPQSVKIHYFCSGPISVDPICPQPMCVCSCPNTVEDILGDPTSTPPGVLLSTLRPRVRKSILQLVPLCNCPVRLSSYT